ncbi:MAG: ABC transporter permease [Firmicutes bacterium]|nr:ABC transporter permease [Bacillota bacterium]
MVVVGSLILLCVFLTAIFAPWLAPYDPYKPGVGNPLEKPSKRHLLGTDNLGRDQLSRLIFGARTAILVGFVSVIIAAVIGITLGIAAGYSRGPANPLIMRLMDALMCFPNILLALVIAAILGGSIVNVIVALTVALIPTYARVACGLTLSVREYDYVLASRLMGFGNFYIMFRHVLPNVFPPIMVLVTLQLGAAILAEAGLSFLGIGIEPPGAAWGAMVSDGYQYMMSNPVLSLAPGLAIMLTGFAFNMVGDGLRDAVDPRLRGLL